MPQLNLQFLHLCFHKKCNQRLDFTFFDRGQMFGLDSRRGQSRRGRRLQLTVFNCAIPRCFCRLFILFVFIFLFNFIGFIFVFLFFFVILSGFFTFLIGLRIFFCAGNVTFFQTSGNGVISCTVFLDSIHMCIHNNTGNFIFDFSKFFHGRFGSCGGNPGVHHASQKGHC